MRFALILITVLPVLHSPSFGRETGVDTIATIYLNNSIIISAQRFGSNTFERYESASVLNQSQISSVSPMSMPQTMAYVPGVFIQKTNHGGGSAFVRGLTGYQTLMMLDGIRLNNSTYRSGPNQYLNTIDPLMISRVEVLRGNGSVQYGSDAIGGTIQMFSLTPEFTEQGWHVGGDMYGKFWSSDMEQTARGMINVSSSRFAMLAGFTYKDLGDIVAGGDLGTESPSGYDEYSMDFKGIYKVGAKHQLTGAYQFLKQMDVPLYHKLVTDEYQRYHFNPQERQLGYLRFESFYRKKLFSEVRYTISYQNSLEVREKQKTGSSVFTEEKDDVHTTGASVEIVSEIKKNWTASSGVEYYHDKVSSGSYSKNLETGESKINRGLYPDNSLYDNFAVFTLHSLTMKKWNIAAGMRYNLVQLQVKDTLFGNTTIRPDALVGNFGVVYKLNNNHHLTAGINSSFRAPNINDVSSFGIADFRFEVPSYDLKSETSLNTEIGYKALFDRFSGAISLFHNNLSDLIANVPSSYNDMDSLDGYKVYTRQNVDEAVIMGGEIETEAKISNAVVAFGNLSYTYGQNTSDDEPLRRIPPLNGRIGFRALFLERFNAMGECFFAGAQRRLAAGDMADDRIAEGGTDGWMVVNLYAGYDHKLFNLTVSAQNIFNEAYRTHGSGIDGIGRSFWLSLRIRINPA
ncbi:MAG: TonB-dependent receptor [Cyclobacteriaceae bacterium]|nr:TonB-dependent receptor [Cyclobacteriaceae bacterium]